MMRWHALALNDCMFRVVWLGAGVGVWGGGWGCRDVGDYLRRVLHIAVKHQHQFLDKVYKTPARVPLLSIGPHMVLARHHEDEIISSFPGAISAGTPAGFVFDCTSLDALVRTTVGAKPALEPIPRTEFAFRGGARALRSADADAAGEVGDAGEVERKGDAPAGQARVEGGDAGPGAGDASVQDACQLLPRLPAAFTDELDADVHDALVARCGSMDRDSTVQELRYLVTLARFAAGAVAEAEAREDAEFDAAAHRTGVDEAVNHDGSPATVDRVASVELAARLAPKALHEYEQELGVGAGGDAGAAAEAGGDAANTAGDGDEADGAADGIGDAMAPAAPRLAGDEMMTSQYRVQHVAHLIRLMVTKLRNEDYLYCRLPASMKVGGRDPLVPLCGAPHPADRTRGQTSNAVPLAHTHARTHEHLCVTRATGAAARRFLSGGAGRRSQGRVVGCASYRPR